MSQLLPFICISLYPAARFYAYVMLRSCIFKARDMRKKLMYWSWKKQTNQKWFDYCNEGKWCSEATQNRVHMFWNCAFHCTHRCLSNEML